MVSGTARRLGWFHQPGALRVKLRCCWVGRANPAYRVDFLCCSGKRYSDPGFMDHTPAGRTSIPSAGAMTRIASPSRASVIHPASAVVPRSEEHTSELQSLLRRSYAVLCLKRQKKHRTELDPTSRKR